MIVVGGSDLLPHVRYDGITDVRGAPEAQRRVAEADEANVHAVQGLFLFAWRAREYAG